MKKIKGIVLFLATLLLICVPLCAQAAGKDGELTAMEAAEQGTVTDADRESLEAYAEESIKMITSMTDEEIGERLNPSTILVTQSKKALESVQSWSDAKDELGAFVEAKEHVITVTDDSITIESSCEFEKGSGVVTTTLDRKDEPFTATILFSAGGEQSLGMAMAHAAMNTVMGLGVVFFTLLFLSFLIGQFRHISNLENKLSKKNETPAPATPAPAPVLEEAEEELADDGELVAVIAAAVAAYEGTSSDGFVVRSIKKSSRNKWQRA